MIDNKELVLTAFETLFNKRDYEAAAKPPLSGWHPNGGASIQGSP